MNLIDKDDMETKLSLLDWDTENRYLVVMSSVGDNKDNTLYDGNNQDVAKAIFNRKYRDMKCIVLYSYSIYGVYTMIDSRVRGND